MRELRMTWCAERDDVADRRNSRHVGAILRIDFYVAAIHLESNALGIEPSRHGSATGCDEEIRHVQGRRAAVGKLKLDVDAVALRARTGHLRVRIASDA